MTDCQLGVCANTAWHRVAAVCPINCGVREFEFYACPAHAKRAALPRCMCGLQLQVLSVTGVPAR